MAQNAAEPPEKEPIFMRFSEAFLLGESLKQSDSSCWCRRTVHGNVAGCAVFGAALAAGFVPVLSDENPFFISSVNLLDFVTEQWPWITVEFRSYISQYYSLVCQGKMTHEGMSNWLRQVEPKEQSDALPVSDSDAVLDLTVA